MDIVFAFIILELMNFISSVWNKKNFNGQKENDE